MDEHGWKLKDELGGMRRAFYSATLLNHNVFLVLNQISCSRILKLEREKEMSQWSFLFFPLPSLSFPLVQTVWLYIKFFNSLTHIHGRMITPHTILSHGGTQDEEE